MNIYDICAYIILGIVILGLIIIMTIKLLWKYTYKWFPMLSSSKIGCFIGFNGSHFILLICAIACVVFGFLFGGIWNGNGIDNNIQQDIKNDTKILIDKSMSAGQKLSNIPDIPSDDEINEMLNISTIANQLKTQFSFVKPMVYSLLPLMRSYEPIKVEIENTARCELVTDIPLLKINITETVEAIEESVSRLNGYSVNIFTDLAKNNKNQQNSISVFKEEMKKDTIHAENIKTTLTKAWKSAVIQYENAVDTRMNKVSEQHQSIFWTNLLTNIGLLCIPLVVILYFIIVSISIHFTSPTSKLHRFLLISNHICYYIIALLILGCAGYIIYSITYSTKHESAIANDNSIYFDVSIPIYDSTSTKSSYQIISKSSGKLFDSPNNDILIGEMVFFENWEAQLVNSLDSLMEDQERNYKFVKHSETITKKWKTLRILTETFSKVLGDSTCNESWPAINEFLKEYGDANKTMLQHMEFMPKNIKSWKELPTKLRGIVKDRVKIVKSSVEKRRNHINDGINILSIDSKSTRKTFAKINNIQVAKNDENMRGIVVLIHCLILIVAFVCEVLYLYTYRTFGPQPPEKAKQPSEQLTPTDSQPNLDKPAPPPPPPLPNLPDAQALPQPAEKQMDVESTQESDLILEVSVIETPIDYRKEWVERVVKLNFDVLKEHFIIVIRRDKCTEVVIDQETMKNRYSVIWPYNIPCIEKTRVKLKDRDENNNFYHANLVHLTNSKRKYIASGGPPTLKDVPNFLHMLFKEKVKIVVMLCPLDDENCARYFPTTLDAENDATLTFGDYSVKFVKFEKCPISDVVCRVLRLKCAKDGSKITIKHIHYSEWPNNSIPKKHGDVLRMIDLAKKWNREYKDKFPIAVHCNDGVGRTGTFIAIDFCDTYLHSSAAQDLYGNVSNLRNMRFEAVKFAHQYVFMCAALVRKYQTFKLISAEETQQFWKAYEEFTSNLDDFFDPTKSRIEQAIKQLV